MRIIFLLIILGNLAVAEQQQHNKFRVLSVPSSRCAMCFPSGCVISIDNLDLDDSGKCISSGHFEFFAGIYHVWAAPKIDCNPKNEFIASVTANSTLGSSPGSATVTFISFTPIHGFIDSGAWINGQKEICEFKELNQP